MSPQSNHSCSPIGVSTYYVSLRVQALTSACLVHNSAFSLLQHGTTLSPSILLNGIGKVNTFAGQPVVDPKLIPTSYTINVGGQTANATRFLLQLINTSFGSTFIVTIDSHIIQVIEVDFMLIQPYTTKEVFIGIS